MADDKKCALCGIKELTEYNAKEEMLEYFCQDCVNTWNLSTECVELLTHFRFSASMRLIAIQAFVRRVRKDQCKHFSLTVHGDCWADTPREGYISKNCYGCAAYAPREAQPEKSCTTCIHSDGANYPVAKCLPSWGKKCNPQDKHERLLHVPRSCENCLTDHEYTDKRCSAIDCWISNGLPHWQPRGAPQQLCGECKHQTGGGCVMKDSTCNYESKTAPACARCGTTDLKAMMTMNTLDGVVCCKCSVLYQPSSFKSCREWKETETATGHPWWIDTQIGKGMKELVKESEKIMFKCEACGYAESRDDVAKFCPGCGTAVVQTEKDPPFLAKVQRENIVLAKAAIEIRGQLEEAQIENAALAQQIADLKRIAETDANAAKEWKRSYEAELTAHNNVTEMFNEQKHLTEKLRQKGIPWKCKRCMKKCHGNFGWPCEDFKDGKCTYINPEVKPASLQQLRRDLRRKERNERRLKEQEELIVKIKQLEATLNDL